MYYHALWVAHWRLSVHGILDWGGRDRVIQHTHQLINDWRKAKGLGLWDWTKHPKKCCCPKCKPKAKAASATPQS